MKAIEYTETVTLTSIECGDCGVIFAMTSAYVNQRRWDHRTWYCPNGHRRHYPAENEAEKARRERDWWKNRAEGEERRVEAEKRSHAATKGKLTRLQKGVCPHCRRNFVNVARHMANQHPGEVVA